MLQHVRATLPRPWWWDGTIALAWAAAGSFTVLHPGLRLLGPGPAIPTAARAAVLLAVCVPLLWRTRRPLAALVAVVPLVALDVVLGLSIVTAFVLADLLYCAVLHASARAGDAVRRGAVGAWGLLVALVVLTLPDVASMISAALSAAALLVLPVLWAGEVRRPVEEAAAERAAAAQAARIAVLDRRAAVTDERARIARDLHDSVAGHLSAISLQSQAARHADEATRDRVLLAVRHDSLRALEEMRALIDVLRAPEAPDASPLQPGTGLRELDALVTSARATGLAVEVLRCDPVDLPPAVDLTAYRLLQEALTNASRHAPGARVDLTAECTEGALVLEVGNDLGARAAGDEPLVGRGSGLEGMRVRAEAVGGHASAGPAGTGRWRVRAVLPLVAGAGAADVGRPAR